MGIWKEKGRKEDEVERGREWLEPFTDPQQQSVSDQAFGQTLLLQRLYIIISDCIMNNIELF